MPFNLVTAALLTAAVALQAGDERPQSPAAPAITEISEADCQDSGRRTALLGDLDAVIEPTSSYGQALNSYNERLMEWRNDQFVRAGRWTEGDAARFAAALLQDPEFANAAQSGLTLAEQVLAPATSAADESKPPLERCHSLIRLQSIFGDILRAVQQQWSVADARYAAEARRLGVAID